MVEYLNEQQQQRDNKTSPTALDLVGSTMTSASKDKALIFLSATQDPVAVIHRLGRDPLLEEHLSKAYVVKPGAIAACSPATQKNQDDGDEGFSLQSKLRHILSSMSQQDDNSNDKTFRIHAFPPSLQPAVLSAIDTWNESDNTHSNDMIRLDPRNFTHILSVVQVYAYQGRKAQTTAANRVDENLYMMGVSPSFTLGRGGRRKSKIVELDDADDTAISRAYYKLKEALSRYQAEDSNNKENKAFTKLDKDFFATATALDCGSAPGGWTKYLAVDQNCRKVYSVDPGELAPFVAALENVEHLRLKLQEAIPLLQQQQQSNKIRIFVSDMCLHNLSEQLDFLALAKTSGILEDQALFVLTLKCTTGYSKQSFDAQVETVLDRMSTTLMTKGVATYHLFSNRSGERTVMGILL